LSGLIIQDIVTSKKSLGHSHVLPPEARAPNSARTVLCKLLHKACERMRSHGMLTGNLTMQLSFLRGGAWAAEMRTPETDVTLRLLKMLDRLWRERPESGSKLLKVGIVLSRLVTKDNYTPELFSTQVADAMSDPNGDGSEKMRKLDETVDRLRALRSPLRVPREHPGIPRPRTDADQLRPCACGENREGLRLLRTSAAYSPDIPLCITFIVTSFKRRDGSALLWASTKPMDKVVIHLRVACSDLAHSRHGSFTTRSLSFVSLRFL